MIDSKKIKIILIVLISLIIVAAAGATVWILSGKLKPAVYKPPSSPTQYSDDFKSLENAIEKKDPRYCEQLKNLNKNDCLYAIADTQNEAKFCDLILDAAINKKCLELIASRKDIASQYATECLLLTDQQIKNDCLTGIFRQQNDLKYCLQFAKETMTLCEDIVYTNLAFKAKDITICEKIQSANNKLNCQSSIEAVPKDSDGDGVPDYLERAYGTDPFNPNSK